MVNIAKDSAIATILIFQNSQIHIAKCLEDIHIVHTSFKHSKRKEEEETMTSVAWFQLPHENERKNRTKPYASINYAARM